MTLRIVNVICWSIIGTCVMCSKKISRFDYGICWFLLMLHLIVRCLTP